MLELTERQKALLNIIIEEHIKSAQPVGSRLLSETDRFDVSPATIRAEMGELEKMGYLTHLHTSGGRVPTDKAYRYYVDNLEYGNLQLSDRYKKRIHEAITQAQGDPNLLNRIIAHALSELTDSVVMTNTVGSNDYIKTGLSELFDIPEFREIERLFNITSFFDEFEMIFEKLNMAMMNNRSSIRVLIGNEHPFRRVRDGAIIQSEYVLPNNRRGVITIIGPTRMNYERNLGLVRYTVDELDKLYNN